MKNKTELEACREWVDGFNAFPQALLEKAYRDEERFEQVEFLAGGERVCEGCGSPMRALTVAEQADDDNDETGSGDLACTSCGRRMAWRWQGSLDAWPAMWGTCWSFSDSCDERWAKDNTEAMADIGFHVFTSDEIGIFIAIDGCGYDFYEAHWLPMYRLRGLHWHDEVTVPENTASA